MNLYVGIKLGDKADGSLSAQLVVGKASYFGLSLMRREDAKLSSRRCNCSHGMSAQQRGATVGSHSVESTSRAEPREPRNQSRVDDDAV